MPPVQVNTASRTLVAMGAAAALLSGCAETPPLAGQPTPVPAGYADGTKNLTTPNLIFSTTSKGLAYDTSGVTGLEDFPVVFQTTSDPNVIIATVNGQNITLTNNGLGFIGDNGTYAVIADNGITSSDGQVIMGTFDVAGPGGTGNAGFYAAGLETDPAEVAAPISPTAIYDSGAALIVINHGANKAQGTGSVYLTADFVAGTVTGTMTVSDNNSDPGFEITSNTVITLDPAPISGNSFAGTWSANPADLSLTSIGTTAIAGKFYGQNAFDIGGSFNGTGVSADGTTPATITGGFLGQ